MEKIKCPDCGKELTEVTIERFQDKTFRIDYENKALVRVYPEQPWETDDYACHCPNCDSLNVDELLSKYKVDVET